MTGEDLKKKLLLYAVTDRYWLNGRSLEQVVRESLDGGVTFVQLREKQLDHAEFLQEAYRIQALCRDYQVPFVINDDVDLALEVDADGVHVGQDDMEAGRVREKLGPDKIIGVSAHSLQEALLAQKHGADYLGVGALFNTSSKEDADHVSFETLREICRAVTIPVIAIGGITQDNVKELAESGICGVAVISAVYGQDDIEQAAEQLKEAVSETVCR